MNKADLVEAVAARLGESKTNANRAVEAVLSGLADGVQRDEKVALAGFGTFRAKDRKARTGINPATKQPIHIPASRTIAFTPSQSLKDRLATPV